MARTSKYPIEIQLQAQTLRKKGLNYPAIAKKLGVKKHTIYNWLNREAMNAKGRAWRKKNRAKFLRSLENWRRNNPDKVKFQRTIQYWKHRDKNRARTKKWQQENRPRFLASMRAYSKRYAVLKKKEAELKIAKIRKEHREDIADFKKTYGV